MGVRDGMWGVVMVYVLQSFGNCGVNIGQCVCVQHSGGKIKTQKKKKNVCVPFNACSHAHWTRFVFFLEKGLSR